MKKRSKLRLNRETLAALDPKQLQVAGADCTCSCCPTDCGCPPATYSCGESCGCDTWQVDSRCICI